MGGSHYSLRGWRWVDHERQLRLPLALASTY